MLDSILCPNCQSCLTSNAADSQEYILCPTCRQAFALPLTSVPFSSEETVDDLPNQVVIVPGHVLGKRYRLESKIGAGGMGVVYKAYDEKLNRWVAVKVAIPFAKPTVLAHLRQEAQTLAQTQHANICKVFDFDDHEQTMYIVMEYISGQSLHDAIQENTPWDAAAAVELVHTVALALQHAHDQGVLHRDLKPSNILLKSTDGSPHRIPMVLDFGLAKLRAAPRLHEPQASDCEAKPVGGTPPYMPWEQWCGQLDVTPAADVYSLGVILFQLLTGRCPYLGNQLEIMTQLYDRVERRDDPVRTSEVNPHLDKRLEAICRKAMALLAEDRYQSMAEFARELESVRSSDWIVDPAGKGQSRTIQDAIRHARPGTTIRIRAGRYSESLALSHDVTLMAEEGGVVVIEPTTGSAIRCTAGRHVLIGLTLLCRPPSAGVRGHHTVRCERGRLQLIRCIIESQSLAALALTQPGAEAHLEECQIRGSPETGILVLPETRIHLERCEVSRHGFSGMEVHPGAEAVLLDSRIEYNTEVGVYFAAGSRGRVRGNRFVGNFRFWCYVMEGAIVEARDNTI